MQDAGRLRPTAAAALAALTLAVVAYGSLYPFRFRPTADWAAAAQALLASWPHLTTRGDVISNFVLYAPLGFFAAQALWRFRAAPTIALVALGGGLISVAIELAQFQSYYRTTALSDVYMNFAGALAGALAGRLAPLVLPRIGPAPEPARGFAAFALAVWLAWRLYPFVPSFDLAQARAALRPLLLADRIPASQWFFHFAAWLAAALLLEAVAGPERRRWAFALLAVCALALRCFIATGPLAPAEVAGAALAVFVWISGLAALEARARIVALLLAAAIAVRALEPFHFLPYPRNFVWIPFRSFIVGSTEANVRALLEKTFLYAGLLWLLARAGLRLGPASLAAAAFVAVLEWAQTWLPRRSAEVTDVLHALVLALVLHASVRRRGDPVT